MLVLAIVALEVPLASSVADRVDAEVRSQARGQADVVAASAADLLGARARDDLRRLVAAAARNVRGRVIVVDADGTLLADSQGARPGADYGGRPEIAAALAGRADQRERRSETLDETLLATAVPILQGRRTAGAVRVTQDVGAVDRAVRRSWLGLALIGLLVLGLGLLAGSLVAGQIARPLRRLDAAARRVAHGDLGTRARVEGSAEQQSLARTFNDMTARLERLVASQRDFVADASHQLRTPLTGLRLRVEAAQAETGDEEARRELDAALAELDRMALMIDELLELSRAGERDAPGELVDLAEAAERAAERWSGEAEARGQRVVARAEPGRAWWIARADLDRILDALVENALRYSPPGTDVTIAADGAGLAVSDEGPGIAPGEEDEVFERFHRGTAGRQGPAGTGLGLPIARELARRWQGDVVLRRRDGGGTVARIPLPILDPDRSTVAP
ncbi:MAG TPA: ATP-binding protein [Solirubrobacteraceae bacterium]|nr:ATP-binding protein [Solirubrobacteraceae bacterium]